LAKMYANIESGPQFRPTAKPSPGRTLFHDLFDSQALTRHVKFYLKDGPTGPATGAPTLVFSKVFHFKLEVLKEGGKIRWPLFY